MFKYLAAFTPSYMTGGCNIRKRYFLRIMLINKGTGKSVYRKQKTADISGTDKTMVR